MTRPSWLLLALAGCGEPPEAQVPRSVDGNWSVVAIDERAAPEGYKLVLEKGLLNGGRDGCNAWGWGPEHNGQRTVESTAVGCAETAERQAYWAIAYDRAATPALEIDGSLVLEGGGHRLRARRTNP